VSISHAPASVNSSSYLKWRFTGQKKWKSLDAKSGEYGGWSNTSNSKCWICFTVWRAVRCQGSSCRRHSRRQQSAQFYSIADLSWFRMISRYLSGILCIFFPGFICMTFVHSTSCKILLDLRKLYFKMTLLEVEPQRHSVNRHCIFLWQTGKYKL
jgi:hypothetical protein